MAKYHAIHSPESGRVWHNGAETSWSKDRDDLHPYRYDMGVSIWAATRDVNPDDRFLDPGGSGAGVGPDDESEDGQGEGQDG